MEIQPTGFLVRGWSQELNGPVRCSGDSTDSRTNRWTQPSAPDRPARGVEPQGADLTIWARGTQLHEYGFTHVYSLCYEGTIEVYLKMVLSMVLLGYSLTTHDTTR